MRGNFVDRICSSSLSFIHIYMCYISNSNIMGLVTGIRKAPMFFAERENPGKTAERMEEKKEVLS